MVLSASLGKGRVWVSTKAFGRKVTESGNENLDGQGGGLGRRRKVGTRTWKGRAEDLEGDAKETKRSEEGRNKGLLASSFMAMHTGALFTGSS
jgi:hypothetical protein